MTFAELSILFDALDDYERGMTHLNTKLNEAARLLLKEIERDMYAADEAALAHEREAARDIALERDREGGE